MLFLKATYLNEAQFYQKSLNEVDIRIVPAADYVPDIHEEMILNAARERLGSEINITIKYLDKIYKTKSGKLKFVISDIR